MELRINILLLGEGIILPNKCENVDFNINSLINNPSNKKKELTAGFDETKFKGEKDLKQN